MSISSLIKLKNSGGDITKKTAALSSSQLHYRKDDNVPVSPSDRTPKFHQAVKRAAVVI